MSLVAYVASSDEDSDNESIDEEQTVTVQPKENINLEKNHVKDGRKLSLPKPREETVDDIEDDDDESISKLNSDTIELKLCLPQPKQSQRYVIEEKDDEFLRKKVEPSLVEKPTASLQAKRANGRQPVKITIPSLAEFKDDEFKKDRPFAAIGPNPSKPCGLLDVLPPPKFVALASKISDSNNTSTNDTIKTKTKTTSLIPHTVSNRLKQNAAATATVTTKSKSNKVDGRKVKESSALGLSYTNSDDSDNDDNNSGDFFSLNNDDKLPEVSASEINAMVTKKAAQMAQFSKNLQTQEQSESSSTSNIEYDTDLSKTVKVYSNQQDQIDIEALVGARAAKRARKDDIQFIDISQDEVKLNQDEWLRNHLQSETEYQPRGHLVSDPGSGTKKKHQITYLAYQAKANEQELQAMWAANRNTRRQTQSKYGF